MYRLSVQSYADPFSFSVMTLSQKDFLLSNSQ